MIEQLWNSIIELSAQFVTPDWGSLVGLIPILLAGIALIVVTWTIYRFATAGPTRRGKHRMEPIPPPGTHMPGPSFAPLLGAFGAFMLVFGLVVGGLWLWVGGAVLAVTMLYWGREALRDYDHVRIADSASASTALVPAGMLPAPEGNPPAGVHIPAPSFRPLLVAIGMTLLVAGLVVGGWAALLGALALTLTGLGWLRDARREYVAVEKADQTGHLDAGGAPAWPIATFAVLALIIAGGLLLSSGLLPSSQGGETAAASGAPAGGGSSAGGAGGAAATPAPSLPEADITVTAENIAFLETSISASADEPFTIALDNKDAGVPHNIAVHDSSGKELFKGEIITGPAATVYDIPPLPAGTYTFVCSVHPNMTGTLTVQ
jgi:plastocyanin